MSFFFSVISRWKQALVWTWLAWPWWCWPSLRGAFPSSICPSFQPGHWPGTLPETYNHCWVWGREQDELLWGKKKFFYDKDNKKIMYGRGVLSAPSSPLDWWNEPWTDGRGNTGSIALCCLHNGPFGDIQQKECIKPEILHKFFPLIHLDK